MVAFATQVKRRRGTEEQNNAFTGAEGEIVVDMTNMTLRVHDGRTRGGFVVGGGAGRNIGDIFFTARTDTSLNGAVEANGGQYNTTDFVGSESIGNILSAGKVPYVTIADFDTAVANNGECTSFGWDGGTVFKVPKINGRRLIRRQLPTADNNYTWYNLYSDGFVEQGGFLSENWTGARTFNFPVAMSDISDTGYTVTDTVGCPNISGMNGLNWLTGKTKTSITFTSRSLAGNFETNNFSWQVNGYAKESEYNDKSTWQYDRYMRPMVQLANGATDEAVVVAGNVLADIAGIKDGDGFTQPGKNAIVGWGMPDYSAGLAVSTSFTAVSDGLVTYTLGTTGSGVAKVNGVTVTQKNIGSNYDNASLTQMFYCSKGDVIVLPSSGKFYPLKGAN